ncbi:MAG: restriction endonuclease subunit S [Nostocales cyanobacterium W4_Combined_metabat2_030]|jgi:type I restriction enzyme S subunit|nr:restriction endonuclease subunit S [Nostocales cyanobacterium W4_Combined_metabat2_030]
MGNYQGYQKYKDSGVEWLGNIPEHWEVKRLKFICTKVQTGTTPPTTQGEYYTEGNLNWFAPSDFKDGQILLKESIKKLNIQALEDRIVKHIPKGSVLIVGIGATLGKVGLLEIDAASNQQINAIFLNKNNNSKFIAYHLFISQEIMKVISNSTTLGILNQEKTKLIPLTFPPLNEQEKIAQFLDYKTKQIDELIKKKETLIEKLDEKRTAIISHAVTKGLDSSVPMKDSGVEWLGDIPKHWEVKRLRYIGSCQNGISKGADYFGFGYPFVNYTDVYANIELPKTVSGLANSTDMDRINYSVQKGDIFFTRTSETIEEIGITSTCFNSINNATFSGFLIRVRPFPNLLFTGFSKYYFRCQLHRLFFVKEMNLVTRASLSQELLKRLPVLLPTIEEQKQISKHLDQKTAQIDQQKAKIKQAIELLKEYRTSLITNAVTGKIDVSQIAVP